MDSLVFFVRNRWPYFLGFAIIEAGIYYFNGVTGNFTTGFLGIFVIWLYYAWTTRPSASAGK
jgi:hypothetical protein